MSGDDTGSLLRETVGGALRAAALYRGRELDLLYMRDDLAARIDEADIERIQQNTVLESIGTAASTRCLPMSGPTRRRSTSSRRRL